MMFLFRNTIAARMLRTLAESGTMMQADFMREYHVRCERDRPSRSSFLNNFGRFVRGRGTTRDLVDCPIDQQWIEGEETKRNGRTRRARGRSMLVWAAPTPAKIIESLTDDDLTATYEALDREMVGLQKAVRKTDRPEETARWVARCKAEIERRANVRLRAA